MSHFPAGTDNSYHIGVAAYPDNPRSEFSRSPGSKTNFKRSQYNGKDQTRELCLVQQHAS
jgi:hypothetical protein